MTKKTIAFSKYECIGIIYSLFYILLTAARWCGKLWLIHYQWCNENVYEGTIWWEVHSQCKVLSFLSHDADSALFGQDGRVLVTDLLIEQHVGVPVPPPHIRVWVGCAQTRTYKHTHQSYSVCASRENNECSGWVSHTFKVPLRSKMCFGFGLTITVQNDVCAEFDTRRPCSPWISV